MKQILLQAREKSQKGSAACPRSMNPSNRAIPQHWWDRFRRWERLCPLHQASSHAQVVLLPLAGLARGTSPPLPLRFCFQHLLVHFVTVAECETGKNAVS